MEKLRSSSDITSLESETYFDIPPDWLPTQPAAFKEFDNTLNKLAAAVQKNHNDTWLIDFLRAPPSLRANELLKQAANYNRIGEPEYAISAAGAAGKMFSRSRNVAGVLRSELEIIYALRRQQQGRKCQERFSAIKPILFSKPYFWLRGRIFIEASGCLAMAGNFDGGSQLAKEAEQIARQNSFESLRLRVLGYLASFHTMAGGLAQSWQMNEAGLQAFWHGPFEQERGYQFYADLEFAAEENKQWLAAAALQSEAIVQLNETGRTALEASAHCRLAKVREIIGDFPAATQELVRSQELFAPLSDPTMALYKADCQIAWASFEARHGLLDLALNHLAAIDPKLIYGIHGYTVQLPFESAWAEVEKRRGNWKAERKHLLKAVSIINQGFRHLKSLQDRWDWRKEASEAYRRLLEAEIESPHRPEQVFVHWEGLRNVEISDLLLPSEYTASNPEPPHLIRSRLRHLRHSTILAASLLSNGISAWIVDDRGIREFHIPASPDMVKSMVLEFHDLCSHAAPIEKVNEAGSRLYRMLVAPFEQMLDPKRTLFIEADDAFGFLPWPALVGSGGKYFGLEYKIVNTPGLLYRKPGNNRTTKMRRILVAYPGAVELGQTRYSPLSGARKESELIAGMYPHADLLKGREVTVDALLAHLPKVDIFHFAGHAITRQQGGELVVHGSGDGELFSAGQLKGMAAKHLRLVTLSACSTAGDADPAHDPNGLVRAFLDVGATTVVASQWDINSETTAELIEEFYQNFEAGQNATAALKAAIQTLRQQPLSSHPYYWAAFQVFGSVNDN